ncbi:hypothetical protein [Flavobacterium sp.]|uniref:hypothetical protein n=1 Tax=Flavobacterium sp. TaxID=239 RepID=UPI00262765B2|nr:hypothetical protein [Flavobacterium sp.]
MVILVLSFISCKDVKPNYKYSFFNDVDKIEHITFEENDFIQKMTSKDATIPKIISSKIILKENFEVLFELLSKKYDNCTLMKCYNPRDIFYFYKKGKKVGFYEFCIECGGSRTSKNLDSLPTFCQEKGVDLDEILKNN